MIQNAIVDAISSLKVELKERDEKRDVAWENRWERWVSEAEVREKAREERALQREERRSCEEKEEREMIEGRIKVLECEVMKIKEKEIRQEEKEEKWMKMKREYEEWRKVRDRNVGMTTRDEEKETENDVEREKNEDRIKRVQRKYKESENEFKREKWWDGECREKKKELLKVVRKIKNGECEIEEKTKKRREYKEMIIRKKEEFYTKETKEIEEDRSMSKFWKAINETKKKRVKISKRIKKEEWVEHFRNQYIRESERDQGKGKSYVYKNKEDEKMEKEELEKTEEEVRQIVGKMKKKKAAGEDKIRI